VRTFAIPNCRPLTRLIAAVNLALYRLTGGRLGGRFGRIRILLLTTKGRRSGRRRTQPLLYVEDGAALAVVASNWGNRRHPAWYLNLQADPPPPSCAAAGAA